MHHTVRAASGLACCAVVHFLHVWNSPALAACTPGARCLVTDGSTEIRANENFHTTGFLVNNAAVAAVNANSTILGTQLTITSSPQPNRYGVYANAGGTVRLTDSTVSSWYGMVANGAGSAIHMTGGALATSGHIALDLGDSANAVFQDVDVSLQAGQTAIFARDGTSFSMTGGSIAAPGVAVTLGDNASVTLDAVDISNANSVSIVFAGNNAGDSALTLLGGTVTNTGSGRAVAVGRGTTVIDGTQIDAAGTGLWAWAPANTLADVQAKNFAITTTGTNGIGVDVWSDATMRLENGDITTAGSQAYGVQNWRSASTLRDVRITTSGTGAHGILSQTNSAATLKGGVITTTGASAGAYAWNNASIVLDGVTVNSSDRGVVVNADAFAHIRNHSAITVTGSNGVGLTLIGTTDANAILLEQSSVQALQSLAVHATGGVNGLRAVSSTLRGDRLIHVEECLPPVCASTFAASVEFQAPDSQLFGHASVSDASFLHMNFLTGGTTWTLSPSASGMVHSDISALSMDKTNRIRFDPQGSGLWQTLVVGSGKPPGDKVYHVEWGADTHITFNTHLNPGGALGNQSTDRLLINGDTSGDSTTVHVLATSGSPGGLTSPGAAYLADEGISLIQVSGYARENSFVLDGGYVTLNDQPYRYGLRAYGPGAANGAAHPAQRLVNGTDPYWDWRLHSEQIAPDEAPDAQDGAGSGAPALSPQAASYLVAPAALFQAGLLDIGTLHRRLGDVRTTAWDSPATRRESFLRAYGGDYNYRSDRNPRQYGYDASVRYTAVQGGGNVYGVDSARSRLRIGLTGSVGDLAFEPHGVADSRKTRMRVWSVAPTLTWQDDSGLAVDAIASWGGFKGNVATRSLGNTATLTGKRLAASVEAGFTLPLGSLTVQPQAQVIYQRLSFARTRARDLGSGFPVALGALTQWTLRAGGELRKRFHTTQGNPLQVYGKLHLAHTLHDGQRVWLGDDFHPGKSGAVVQAGLGLDAAFAGGKTVIYADVTRQNRIRRAGHQGWTVNLGANIRF